MNEKMDQDLDYLFHQWKQSYGKQAIDFSADGIIDEDAWNTTTLKTLFLMKETNDFRGDLRIFVQDNPWEVVGQWAYGLKNSSHAKYPLFNEAQDSTNYRDGCISSAIVNLKKLTGEGTANMAKVEEAALRDADFIREEIEIMDPDVVVCCGSGVFNIARKIIPGLSDSVAVDPDGKCFQHGKTVWINHCHPSARYGRYMMYYTLMVIYQNYLQHS